MVQPRETHVDGQHHPQQELVDGHHARNAVNGQSFFNQFLEAQFLQHGRYGEQTTIGRKISWPRSQKAWKPQFYRAPDYLPESLVWHGFSRYAAFRSSPFG